MKYDYLKSWQNDTFKKLDGRGKNLKFLLHQPTGDNDLCIDLHTHTVSSDGMRDDKKLLKEAIENNVDVIAITDHDTIAGCNLVRKSQLEEKRFSDLNF